TTGMQRLADVAMALTIQVNSSLGTTPILLAHDKDLPKARKEVGLFVTDTGLQQEIQKGLTDVEEIAGGDARRTEARQRALDMRPKVRWSSGTPLQLGEARYWLLDKRLQQVVFSRAALKGLARRFIQSWQQAGTASHAGDLVAMRAKVHES